MNDYPSTQMEQHVDVLLPCALDCLKSSTCGWIMLDGNSHQCSTHDTMDYNHIRKKEVQNNDSLSIYKRLYTDMHFERNKRSSTYKLVDATEMEFMTTTTASCDSPPSLPNAGVEYDTHVPGSTAKYICNDGFSFCGYIQKEVTCLGNGSWEQLNTGCSQNKFFAVPVDLPCPLTNGSIIEINGFPNDNSTFFVRFYDVSENIVFYMMVRFNVIGKNSVVFNNHDKMGKSGFEEYADTFPFKLWKQFNLTIIVEKEQYALLVDEKPFMKFNHRRAPETVSKINVERGVQVNYVIFSFPISIQKEETFLGNVSWEPPKTGCSQNKFSTIPVNLPCPLNTGSIIEISGFPNGESGFVVSLYDVLKNTVFHMMARFNLKDGNPVVFNNRVNTGRWGLEEYADTFPFKLWKKFNLTIVVQKKQYVVLVDEKPFTTFKHRSRPQTVTKIDVWRDVKFNYVEISYVTG
ncbi:galectin-8-like [Gigantopelta aegis]|uniref:galectin-8-like n=1 Tax=Gigantopelta aegis TaxID=1735272 RepID=UPI001B88CB65|nr:galectin-8-like [Gigantopelta aegis]